MCLSQFECVWFNALEGSVRDGGSAFGFIFALLIYKIVFKVTSPKFSGDHLEYLGIVSSLCSVAGLLRCLFAALKLQPEP